MSKDSDKPHAMQPEDTPALRALYRGFEENHLNPLWTQTANLATTSQTRGGPACLGVGKLYELAKRSRILCPLVAGGTARDWFGTKVVAPIFPQRFGAAVHIWDHARTH